MGIQYRQIMRAVKRNNLQLSGDKVYFQGNKVCGTGAIGVTLLGIERAREVMDKCYSLVGTRDENPDRLKNPNRGAIAKTANIDPDKLLAVEAGYEEHDLKYHPWIKGKYTRYVNIGRRLAQHKVRTYYFVD